VDTANTQVMSIRLSSEELQKIDAGAAAAGMSRPEYARSKLLETKNGSLESRLQKLEDFMVYGLSLLNQVHEALYLITETQGKVQRFLSTEELAEIDDQARADSILFAVEIPGKFAARQAEIAAAAKNGAK
jgi:hypothetical protein